LVKFLSERKPEEIPRSYSLEIVEMGSALIVSKALAGNAGNFEEDHPAIQMKRLQRVLRQKKTPPSLQREDGAFYRPGF